MKLMIRILVSAALIASTFMLAACGSSGSSRTKVSYGMGYRGYYGERPWGDYPGYIGVGGAEVDPDWGVNIDEPIAVPYDMPDMGMPDMGGMDFGGFDF